MDKKPLIGVSILAVVLLVLGSLSNVVGYQTYQVSNNVEKDDTLYSDINQSSDSGCDCDNEKTIGLWKFPITCMGLYAIFAFFYTLYLLDVRIAYDFVVRLNKMGTDLDCFWAPFIEVNQ
jgi:hypothetical protein